MADDPAGAVFSALSDPTRREVVQELAASGSLTATELAARLPVSRQAVMKHLDALAGAHLVTCEKAGRAKRYRLTPAPMEQAVGWMAGVGAEWDARLSALRDHLAGDAPGERGSS